MSVTPLRHLVVSGNGLQGESRLRMAGTRGTGGGGAPVERVRGADHHHLLALDRLLDHDEIRGWIDDSRRAGDRSEGDKQRGDGNGGGMGRGLWSRAAPFGPSSRSTNRPFRTLRERKAKPPELYAMPAPAGGPQDPWSCLRFEPAI